MNLTHTMSLMVGELTVACRRQWRSAGPTFCRAILGLLLARGLPVAAQEPDVAGLTNDAVAAEVLARISEMVQAAESDQPEDMAALNSLMATNDLSQASAPPQGSNRFEHGGRADSTNRFQSPSRSQNDDRRSRGRRSFRSKSDQGSSSRSASDYSRGGDGAPASASEGTNASLAGLDYSAFRIIVDRNIFDPNRYPRRGPRPVQSAPKPFDSLTLVGTMSYEKGAFAFFDGSSSEYKKALKLSDVIAGYKVTNIAPSGVTLAAAGTNALQLNVGMQLRREENGPWLLAGKSGSYTTTPTTTTTTTSTNAVTATGTTGPEAASGAAESDTIKKLMQRRAQE